MDSMYLQQTNIQAANANARAMSAAAAACLIEAHSLGGLY